MICFYHPSKFSSYIRLVERLACCRRPDAPWVAMYPPQPKESPKMHRPAVAHADIGLPCAWALVPHKEALKDWSWTKWESRSSPLVHNFSLVRWTPTCTFPWLYLTTWDALAVLFLQAVSLLWAPFLLFSGEGRYLMKSLRSSSCVHFWAPSSPCAFSFIQGNNFSPSKDNSNSHTVYNTKTFDRATVYHHWGRRKRLTYIFQEIH